jgi:5'-nucleotidase
LQFIHWDPLLPTVLRTLRASGRRVFIATNSLWDFTNVVMNYLLLGKSGDDKSLEWLSFFDVVYTGCQKPAFFERGMLFQVDTKTGLLCNTDNGAPTVSLDGYSPNLNQTSPDVVLASSSSSSSSSVASVSASDAKCNVFLSQNHAKVFQGGSYRDVHRMFGIKSGEEVLYVGDHIYGDIITSKSSVGWRTMLVVPELDVELSMLDPSTRVNLELRLLRAQRDKVSGT